MLQLLAAILDFRNCVQTKMHFKIVLFYIFLFKISYSTLVHSKISIQTWFNLCVVAACTGWYQLLVFQLNTVKSISAPFLNNYTKFLWNYSFRLHISKVWTTFTLCLIAFLHLPNAKLSIMICFFQCYFDRRRCVAARGGVEKERKINNTFWLCNKETVEQKENGKECEHRKAIEIKTGISIIGTTVVD